MGRGGGHGRLEVKRREAEQRFRVRYTLEVPEHGFGSRILGIDAWLHARQGEMHEAASFPHRVHVYLPDARALRDFVEWYERGLPHPTAPV